MFHHFDGTRGGGAYHHAVGFHKVFNSNAFAQKFGIGDHVEEFCAEIFGEDGVYFFGGADGYGAFIHDDGIVLDHAAQLPRYAEDV